MSGAEASLVLGLVSSIIQIINAVKDVYDAANDANGLPQAFRDVAAKLDLIQLLLEEAEEHISSFDGDAKKSKALIKVLEVCQKRAVELHEIFTTVVPKDGSSRLAKYMLALKKLGKGARVENLTGEIFKEISLLATYFSFPESTKQTIASALEDVLMIEPSSLPEVFDDDSVVEGARLKSLREFRYKSLLNRPKPDSKLDVKDLLHSWLIPNGMNYLSDQKHHLKKRFINPETSYTTCDWFFRTPEFGDFLNPNASPVLRVRASPGCGKSVLSSTVVSHFELNPDTCVLYCYLHRDPEPTSSLSLVRVLLAQTLQWSDPQIIVALSKFHSDNLTIDEQDGKKEEELWRILRGIMAAETRKLSLVVDGLDECAQPLLCMKSLLKIITKLATTTKPKLFISSRLEDRDVFENKTVRAFFSKPGVLSIQMEIRDEGTCRDVREIVAHRVVSHPSFSSKSAKIKEKIIRGVCERANGMFLYATLVLDDLKDNRNSTSSVSAIDTTLAKLPKGLFNSYEQSLDIPRNSIKGFEAFSWIFCSNLCLTWEELKSALAIGNVGVEEDELIDDSCEAFIEHSCGRLVESFGPSDSLRFIHPTVKDFLIERLKNDGPGIGIGIEKAHSMVAHKLLKFLEYPDLPVFSSSVDTDPEEIITAYSLQPGRSLYRFATFNWYRHLQECDKMEDAELEEQVLKFLNSSSFIRWLKSAIIMCHSMGNGDSVSLTVDVNNAVQVWAQSRSWADKASAQKAQTWIQDFLHLMLDWGAVLQTQPDWVDYLHHQLLSGDTFRKILEVDEDHNVVQINPGKISTKSSETASWPPRTFAVDLQRDLAFTYDDPYVSCFHMKTGLHIAEIMIDLPAKVKGPVVVKKGMLSSNGKYIAILLEVLGPSSDPIGAQIRAGQMLSFNDTTCKFSWSLGKGADLAFPAFMLRMTFGVDNAEFVVCLLEINHVGPARTNLFSSPGWTTSSCIVHGFQTMRWELDDVDILHFSSDSSRLATPFGIVDLKTGDKTKPWSFALDHFYQCGKLDDNLGMFATVVSGIVGLNKVQSDVIGNTTSTLQLYDVRSDTSKYIVQPGMAHILAISTQGRFFLLLRTQIVVRSKKGKDGQLKSQQGTIGIWDCHQPNEFIPLLYLDPPATGQRAPWNFYTDVFQPRFCPEAKGSNEINKVFLYAPPKWKLAKTVSPCSSLDPEEGHLLIFEAKKSTTPDKGFGSFLMLKLQLPTSTLKKSTTELGSGLYILSWSPHFDVATIYCDSTLSAVNRADLKSIILSASENRRLVREGKTNIGGHNRNDVSALLCSYDRSAIFWIHITTQASENSFDKLTNDRQMMPLEQQCPIQYNISVSCLREGESFAIHSTTLHTALPYTCYPPLTLQYACVTSENELNLGPLQLNLSYTFEAMNISMGNPRNSIFETAKKCFKLQARPLRCNDSLSAICKENGDNLELRYSIFENAELTFEGDLHLSEIPTRSSKPFVAIGSSTTYDHLNVFQYSRLINKKTKLQNKHEARQFEVYLCVFDLTEERISWLLHTTTGGEISQSMGDSPEVAWALHPHLPLLIWHMPGHRFSVSNFESKESPVSIAESLTLEADVSQAIKLSPSGRYVAAQARQSFKNDLMNFRTGQTLWSIILCDLVEGKSIEGTMESDSNISVELKDDFMYAYRLSRDGAIESSVYNLMDLKLVKRQYLTFIPARCCCQSCGKPFEHSCFISIVEHQGVQSVILGHSPLGVGKSSIKTPACEPLILRITSPPVDQVHLGENDDVKTRFIITSSRVFSKIIDTRGELLENAFDDSLRHCESRGSSCMCCVCTTGITPSATSWDHSGIQQLRNVISDFEVVRAVKSQLLEPDVVEGFLRKLERSMTKRLLFEESANTKTRDALMHYKKTFGDEYFPWDSWEDFREAMKHAETEFDFNAYMEKLFEPGKCGVGCTIPLPVNTFRFRDGGDSQKEDFQWSSAIAVGWIEEDLKWFYDRLFGGDFQGARKWYPFPAYCAFASRTKELKADRTVKGARYRKYWEGTEDARDREILAALPPPEREGASDNFSSVLNSEDDTSGMMYPLKMKEVFESVSDIVPGFGNFFEQRIRTILNQSLIGDLVLEDIT